MINNNQEIVKWMKMETQFLAEQNKPERFAELIQSIKPLVGNGYDLQVDDFDIPFTLDRECLELIYSQISLDETQLRVNYSNPLGYKKGNNQITINAIGMKNLSGNYRSPAHLYHAIQVHLLGRSDLINVVRDSYNPFTDSYIKRSGKVDGKLYSAWEDIKVDESKAPSKSIENQLIIISARIGKI